MALWYNYFRPSVYPYVAVQYRISIIKGVLLPIIYIVPILEINETKLRLKDSDVT